tara:strand:- start:120 stop:1028 length:909 start_codon:yes stop_codon:yes gene_type:complete
VKAVNLYRCINCGNDNLDLDEFNNLSCKACKTEFLFSKKGNFYSFFVESNKHDDNFLKEINLEDLQDGEVSSSDSMVRLHSEDVYIQSEYSQKLIEEFNLEDNSFILDHGCGRGHFSEFFIKKGHEVVSADILEVNFLNFESSHKAACNLNLIPFKDNSFDAVLSLDVFEHLIPDSMDEVISEIYRVLKPGGKLMISFPGNVIPDYVGNHLINIFIFFMRLFGSDYPYMRPNSDCKAHINLHSPFYFKKAFKKAGFHGNLRPFTNKFLTLPKKFFFLARLLNFPIFSPFFIPTMHGVLTKPK